MTQVISSAELPFEQEYCDRHREAIPADLVVNASCGTYVWRCPTCKVGWVTVGSPMDVANTIAYANCTETENGAN